MRGRLILHVGAPKCGSSSLQTALSRTPDLISRTGERLRYLAIRGHGELLAGDALQQAAEASAARHAPSLNVPELATLGISGLAGLATQLAAMLSDASVILSCEGWLERPNPFAELGLLGTLAATAATVEVVAYVRPQVDYLNSAWWQWGAWSPFPQDVWLYFQDLAGSWLWSTLLQGWSAVEGVTSVRVRSSDRDVVADFFDMIACERPPESRLNRSLPPVALRFLQRHRELRPDPHTSEIDFILERALSQWSDPVPWVIAPDYAAYVVEKARPDNEALLDLLPPVDRAAMLADPRWWDASCYAGRQVETTEPIAADGVEMDRVAAALAAALQAAEGELSRLRSRPADPDGDQ